MARNNMGQNSNGTMDGAEMNAEEMRMWLRSVQEARSWSDGAEDWSFYNQWVDEFLYAAAADLLGGR